MALTGKTIGQLTYLSGVTIDTLFPVELSGDTFHIAYSAFTNSNYNTGTYDELYSYATGGTLSAGSYYLMTDYQTCYDQPNFDSIGNPIITGNYKTGSTESLLLLATSTTGFSPTVFSTLYPKDKITYDITWNTTEVTSSPAKGRITERIDDRNNRADYDFRGVQFIRYVGFFSEQYLPGRVTLDGGSGLVTGTNTFFQTNFSVGSIIGIFVGSGDNGPISAFEYFEVTQIDSDTSMYVTGRNLTYITNAWYSFANTLPNYSSPYQCNVTGGTNDESAEYYTFNSNQNWNTYLGDNQNYSTFILSNNVFKSGNYENMFFGGNVVGNTFDNVMRGTTVDSFCQYNIITNNFDYNVVGPNFQKNIIECDMRGNTIGELFQFNTLGDDDGNDFDWNTIGPRFQGNFLTFANNDFINNIIGETFTNNLIDEGFANNEIKGSFNNNLVRGSDFEDNYIGNSFYSNDILSSFRRNTIGDTFYNNLINGSFEDNKIGSNSSANIFNSSFTNNQVGISFVQNGFSGSTTGNIIGAYFQNNNIDYNFAYNTIGVSFQNNNIANDFGFGGGNYRGNIIGNGFIGNTVGEYCYDNTFGDECYNNSLSDNFRNNKVSYNFYGVTINNLDVPGTAFQNNNFTYGIFNTNLTLSGGTGGNPIFYTEYTTNVMKDAGDTNPYVTFLSGGTIVAQDVIVVPVTPTPTPSVTPTQTPAVSVTPTETPTSTVTPTVTDTPAVTPTNTLTVTPTPSPVWLLSILNSNATRSVTAVNFNGVTENLELGSYPVVNGNGYSATHPSVSGAGGDVMLITFGGSGSNGPGSQILINGVDSGFPFANYAGNPFNCGGLAIASGDQITIIID